MAIDFFYMEGSPPCAMVSLTFAALGIESKVKSYHVDYRTKEYLKPEFVKLNPQHTAPTIVDDGFVLWESRAIARYLVNKYGKSTLYPEDYQTRAVVDQRLDFDLGTLYTRFTDYYYPQFMDGTPVEEAKLKKLQEALDFFNSFLEDKEYAAGSALTLADFSLVVTMSFVEAADISFKEYPNIIRWFDLAKSTMPKYEEIVLKYVKDFTDVLAKITKSSKVKCHLIS